MEETIELKKKQNWIEANKLTLDSSLAFYPQMWKIAESWILIKPQSGKAESRI